MEASAVSLLIFGCHGGPFLSRLCPILPSGWFPTPGHVLRTSRHLSLLTSILAYTAAAIIAYVQRRHLRRADCHSGACSPGRVSSNEINVPLGRWCSHYTCSRQISSPRQHHPSCSFLLANPTRPFSISKATNRALSMESPRIVTLPSCPELCMPPQHMDGSCTVGP